MQRTIQTPHDVVQILIDIIATHENKFAIYTEYNKYETHVHVAIITQEYKYLCKYKPCGISVSIHRYKNEYKIENYISEACTFNVYDDISGFVCVDIIPNKIKYVYL